MQKEIIFISGTIGSGKSTIANRLVNIIPNSVMLDGDWCFQQGKDWHFDKATKQMAIQNIIFTLNNLLNNNNFETVIFCWTLHHLDIIINSLNFEKIKNFHHFSLLCNEETLKKRIIKRYENRFNEIKIPYNENDIKRDFLGAKEKMDYYLTNDAIKLDGNKDLEIITGEIINYMHSINHKKHK